MFFWIYDIPSWLLLVTFVGAFTAFTIAGLFPGRLLGNRLFSNETHRSEILSLTLHTATILYSLLLALIAVSTYEKYSAAEDVTSREASSLGVLYRDASAFPEPSRSMMQKRLREYAQYVVTEAWPLQRKGILPERGVQVVTDLQRQLFSFKPSNTNERALRDATTSQFNDFAEARRARLDAVDSALPSLLWVVLTLGILISIFLTWLLPVKKIGAHLVVAVAYAMLCSLVLALVAAIAFPFRGTFSVTAHPFVVLLRTLMHS